jgi:hypothetical protein
MYWTKAGRDMKGNLESYETKAMQALLQIVS